MFKNDLKIRTFFNVKNLLMTQVWTHVPEIFTGRAQAKDRSHAEISGESKLDDPRSPLSTRWPLLLRGSADSAYDAMFLSGNSSHLSGPRCLKLKKNGSNLPNIARWMAGILWTEISLWTISPTWRKCQRNPATTWKRPCRTITKSRCKRCWWTLGT